MPIGFICCGHKPSYRRKEILLSPSHSRIKISLANMLKELECPTCTKICTTPIETCVHGHIICNACVKIFQQCPTCQSGFKGTRNFFAESIVAHYSKCCKFSPDGCQFVRWKGESIRNHENKCLFRPIACIIASCKKDIPYDGLLKHLINMHGINGTGQQFGKVTFLYKPVLNPSPYYVSTFDNLFFVGIKVASPYLFIWVWIQPKSIDTLDKYKFTAKITFKDTEKYLVNEWNGPVHSLRTSEEEILEGGLCFTASEEILKLYENHGVTSFHFRVNQHDLKIQTTATDNENSNLLGAIESRHSQGTEIKIVGAIFDNSHSNLKNTSTIPTCEGHFSHEHLLQNIKFGTNTLPTDVVYRMAEVEFHRKLGNRKWLAYYINAFHRVFYVLMELIRSDLWIWIYLSPYSSSNNLGVSSTERNKEIIFQNGLSKASDFRATIMLESEEKSMSYRWEGEVHSSIIGPEKIWKQGRCFGGSTKVIKHFVIDDCISFSVDILKI